MDGLRDAHVYIDLGDDSDEDQYAALARMMEKSRESVMTVEGARRLFALFEGHKTIFEFGWASLDQPTPPKGNMARTRPAGSEVQALLILSRSARISGEI